MLDGFAFKSWSLFVFVSISGFGLPPGGGRVHCRDKCLMMVHAMTTRQCLPPTKPFFSIVLGFWFFIFCFSKTEPSLWSFGLEIGGQLIVWKLAEAYTHCLLRPFCLPVFYLWKASGAAASLCLEGPLTHNNSCFVGMFIQFPPLFVFPPCSSLLAL